MQGWPVMTILRGQVVFRDGEPIGSPQGAPVQCGDPTDDVGHRKV